MRFIKVTAIILAFAIIFAGCNMIEVNEERDRETVIAKVGDEVVLKGEYKDMYDMYEMYGYFYYYPEDWATNSQYKETYQEIVKSIIDDLVYSKVLEVTAREKGCYDFTEEQRQELDEEINGVLDTYIEMYALELAEEEQYADMSEEELTAIASDTIDVYFEKNNFGITKQEIIDNFEDSKAQDLLYEMTTESIEVTEDEVKAEYDAKVEEQKAEYEEYPSSFEQDVNNDVELYYIPEGARQAQHILISISDEEQEEIAALRESGDDESADALLNEALANIQEAADSAYERAIAGEDFKLLIDELGEDPGMESSDYYVVMNPTSTFVTEFGEGLFALQNVGDISEPIATDYGYHIIKYYGDMESGPVPYDDLRDGIYESMLSERQDAYFEEQAEIWKEDTKITTYYKRAMK